MRRQHIEVDVGQGKPRLHDVHAGHQRRGDGLQARGRLARPGDGQRAIAQHGIGEQERYAPAVVTVKVGDEHGIDGVVGDAEALQGDEARRPEIDAEAEAGRIDEKAGIEPASGAKFR
jgi:hypothetical protein